MNFVEVAVKSAWWSKINWTQAIGMLASVGVLFGMHLSPDEQAKIVVTIQAISGVATVILRTWFTTSVTPAVAEKIEGQ